MKIEIIFKKNYLNDLLDNIVIPNDVSKQVKYFNGLNSVIYETQDNSIKSAKILSKICENFIMRKDDCYIATNEAAALFNLYLYPKFNQFERNLRKLIFVVAIKSNDCEMVKNASHIEGPNFSNIMNRLFNNGEPLKKIKKRTDQPDFVSQMRLKHINDLPKKSLWSYFVSQESYLAEHFEEIVDYRNDIMHAKNISFDRFVQINRAIESAITEVELLTVRYINQEFYLTTTQQKVFDKMIMSLIKKPKVD